MGVKVFSFPFRLLPNGAIGTVEQGTDGADAESVAMLVATRVGERPLAPSFGIPDPTFSTVSEHDVVAAVTAFLPTVRVQSVDVDRVDQRSQQVRIELGDANAQP